MTLQIYFDIILYVSLTHQYPWITFICCNYFLAIFCNMHEGGLLTFIVDEYSFLGSRVEINNQDYVCYIWNVTWEVPMKKVIISSHNIFLTWITITAEISRNVTSVSLIWARAAILAAILMVILNFVVPYRLLSFFCIHNIAKLS